MKYALVTGGSRGIGRAICIQLARDGFYVIINYKQNHEAANDTLRMIVADGGQAGLLPFDVSDPEAINKALDLWEQSHENEHISVLVNNAGIAKDDVLLDLSPSDWHSVVDTNLNGFFYITRRVLTGMLMAHYGRIINMTSIAGQYGFNGQVNYSTAKAALIGATKSLAKEVAPKRITVNAVAPGVILTDMTKDSIDESSRQRIPMRRFGTPQEVADLVSFLASDKASYISGQVIGINGGWL